MLFARGLAVHVNVLTHLFYIIIADGRTNTTGKPSNSGESSSLSTLGIGLVAAGATVGAAGIVGLGFGLLVWTRRRRERASVGARDSAKLEWEASTDALQPPNLPGYEIA